MSKSAKRNPGRKRRLASWALLALAVALAIMWPVSRWWQVIATNNTWHVVIRRGAVEFVGNQEWQYTPGLHVARLYPHELDFNWLAPYAAVPASKHRDFWVGDLTMNDGFTLRLYLWPLILLLGAGGWPAVRSVVLARRQARIGLCLDCGYDKRGLAAGAVCPECGK